MTAPRKRIRLLMVDDDEGMVATLRDVLAASGYGVDLAFSVIRRSADRRLAARELT